MHGDGSYASLAAMEIDQIFQIQGGKDISVADQERIVQAGYQCKRPSCP